MHNAGTTNALAIANIINLFMQTILNQMPTCFPTNCIALRNGAAAAFIALIQEPYSRNPTPEKEP